ncbi:acyltransferase family protein [Jatrophihabitans sp.]|uniref:acyltransferase family protein n=1 Tax=Jatrophihabitans sp. TaxID=1932789 RepID=UPI0030C6EE67|nr:O-antigen acetylase [Jatrophihabitans sp.]
MSQVQTWDAIFEGPPIAAEENIAAGRRSRAGKRGRAGQQRRADIQGLRAIAVVLVVVDHLGSWPHGGFIGVDVFFVISGFLITGLLVRAAGSEVGVGGYFGHFYRNRARRILPAALTTLAACWVAANLAFRGARVAQSHDDILWSLGFAANVHFSNIGTDYFQSTEPPSIVQHFWSLAVEEQYYVVWPIVVLLIVGIFGRRQARALTPLLVVTALLVAGSFALAVHDTHSNATAAYFSTPVRAWELGVGALLAVGFARFPGMADRLGVLRGPLVLLGTAGILASAVLVKSTQSFPAPAAAAPVLATALVIFAGTTREQLHGARAWSALLTNRVSSYLGEISFSLYLWHWPAIIVIGALIPTGSARFYVMAVLVSLGMSILSYQFVETPFRSKSAGDSERRNNLAAFSALAAAAALVAGVGVYAFRPDPPAPPAAALAAAPAGASTSDPYLAPASAAITQSIRDALAATSFPKLTPDLSHLGHTAARTEIWNGCQTDTAVVASCIYRPSGKSNGKVALVLGDSIAMSWMTSIHAALVAQGWTVEGFMRTQCTAAMVEVQVTATGEGSSEGCSRHHQQVGAIVKQVKPDLVVMSSADLTLGEIAGAKDTASAITAYTQGMIATQKLVSAPGRTVVTLSPPPRGKALLDCDTAGAVPADCIGQVNEQWRQQSAADKAAAKATGTKYIDTRPWFCSASDYCPAFSGSTAMLYDTGHMTKEYGQVLAPEMATALQQ